MPHTDQLLFQTFDGKCLSVDQLSGDFRANLTPVQVAACNGTAGQKWDVITAGKHNNLPGTMLVVSTLVSDTKHNDSDTSNLTNLQTNACLNIDDRRAAGNQVLLFSCGGRADGGAYSLFLYMFAMTLIGPGTGGQQTNSQLFKFLGGAGPETLEPLSNVGTCLVVKGNVLDQAKCGGKGDTFTFG